LKEISLRKNFKMINKPKGLRRQWVKMALKNAQEQLSSYLIKNLNWKNKFESLKNFLDLNKEIKRIECVDISHHQGEGTVGSCVVFNQEGPDKKLYRKLNNFLIIVNNFEWIRKHYLHLHKFSHLFKK